ARDEPELARRLALALYRAGEPEGALDSLTAWLAAEPGDVRARLLQSLLLSALGREVEAVGVLEELRRSRPDDLEVATLLARHHTARREWQAALAISEPLLDAGVDEERAELALLSAEALRGDGRALEALDRLALLGRGLEQHPRALALSAEILFALDRAPEAEETIAQLMAAPEPERLALVAAVYQRAERYPEAIGVLEKLLEQEPQRVEALFWLGAAYERTRDYGRAEESFRRLLAVEPDFAPALNYLGYMWAERGTNLDEALALVERAVTLEPDNGAYLDSLGWAHFQRGDYAAAQGNLERAAELTADDATVLEHLGDVYRALGRMEEAGSAYQRALELHDENALSLQHKLEALGRPD
ncbi:MAG: tetratricopeptide repeat protein, partial [Thermoanaerobaculia bacterium]